MAHEGLNFAAVQRVPVVFIIQNNQVALGTKLEQHHVAAGHGNFADWPKAYGMWGGVFDGNNVLDAYAAASLAVARCRRGEGPAMLVAETFRMGGHATHDEAEARNTFSAQLFSSWGRRDPVALYEEYLCDAGIARLRLEEIAAECGGGSGARRAGGAGEPRAAHAGRCERHRRRLREVGFLTKGTPRRGPCGAGRA